MPMRPVRVLFFYKTADGDPIDPHDYPKEMEFPGFTFAEELTREHIQLALIDELKALELPHGTDINWTIIDDVPEGRIH